MQKPTITDICLITRDLDRSIEFYTEKLGYTLKHRMPGFADFAGPGVILALWDAEHIQKTTGVVSQREEPQGHNVMLAVKLDSPEDIDRMHDDLVARSVDFYDAPADYPWNARCLYLAGPCGELWEFFAWYDGGEPGAINASSAQKPVSL
ncbi:VOC family protein [Paeniglutamicibacter sp. ABSL32-1]|uniref:VOC family protein n=1 Tax=Paeniglutamicibacter quisquiliarum TaxID=2849498 RepID=UPI001C2D3EB9|nr:VOC family protein [Paeniglutamicibacter quisquiliarum]MBV1780043.1 VOC family protein [Paeniglutamicibacter quisquiliarum]